MGKVLQMGGPKAPTEEVSSEQPQDGLSEEAFQQLMGQSVEDILREGQKALFARLVSVCRSGSASHQELAILRNILKDNGMTLGIPPEVQTPVEQSDLPVYGEPEE